MWVRAEMQLSALEIEGELLTHPDILEVRARMTARGRQALPMPGADASLVQVAICGVEDEVYGQVVGAVVALQDRGTALDIKSLREWGSNFLAPYKLPKLLRLVESIPRNAMGKVNKKQLVKIFDA